jgi:hypothetical protein|tara:strand:- start:904 stop:1194 length:291 start_codon:yes stop_codon:yes gene_type:complete
MAVKTKTETPKSTEPKKIEEKDLNTLKQLQADTDKLVYNLGQLYVQKQKLNDTEDGLLEAMKAIENREEALGKELSAKYGIGTVNIEAGTFTPQAS